MKITDIPKRKLRNDFTDYTMKHAVLARKRALRWHGLQAKQTAPSRKESIPMKIIHKPLLAGLTVIAIFAVGGTSYAAVNGGLSSITALFGGEKNVQDARIVKVDLTNCHDVTPFNVVSGTQTGNEPRYYEVQDAAHLSNQQVVAMAQGICRASYMPTSAQVPVNPQVENGAVDADNLIGNAEGVVVGVTKNDVAIQVSGAVTSSHRPFVEHFTHFDTEVKSTGTKLDISDLKVGDVVYSSFRSADGSLAVANTPLDQVNWNNQVLVSVMKQTSDEKIYDQYQALVRKKLVQEVVPCTTTGTGYCTFGQLQQK